MKLSALVLVAAVSAAAFAKSSEIPDRREFPVDSSVNPCTDFFKYACNKVIDSFQLREDRSSHAFSFSDASERLLDYKKKYFSGLSQAEPKSPREASLKSFYLACMNEPSRAAEEKALVAEVKKQTAAIKDREGLLELFAKNRLEGLETPLHFFSESNLDKPLYNDLALDTGWVSLPEKTYYEKPALVEDLTRLITKFYKTIGESHPEKKAKMVVEFEKGMAKANLLPAERREIENVRTGITRADLLKEYPLFKLNSLLDEVPESTHIRHMFPRSLDYMHERLGAIPLDDLKSMYLYYMLAKYMDDGYPEYFKEKFDFDKRNFGGPNVRPERQERCTQNVMHQFMPEVDSLLWTRVFPGFPTKTVVVLSEKIRKSILTSLKSNTWLSPQAKKEAIHKMKTAFLQLVAPQNDLEWNFHLVGHYANENPLHNQMQYSKLAIAKEFQDFKGPISPKRWYMGPLTVNAYYDDSYNKFVLPVGILQYPFFDPKSPMEVNLGAIGSVIGHELGHGIDDQGSRYDAEGKLRQWMTDADTRGFKDRTKILITQFNAAGQNGELTLGENIGDLVGVTASHAAAFDGKKIDPELEKAYFTQYARVWCYVMRPKRAELEIKVNPHSQDHARVNEQVRQQPAFKRAFACKDNDAMVLPAEKLVHLW